MNLQNRLNKVIPGGSHTYSKGYDQFPINAPSLLTKGEGVYVFDELNNKFLDFGMGLRAVNIGYAEPEINEAAFIEMSKGNNLTRPSLIELEAAELLVDLIDSVEMVKFTKNGSAAVTAAIKLARAYTGRELIARCADQPFFSYDDWFIGSTSISRGIPLDTITKTKTFNYNNLQSIINLVEEYPNQIACVILEPASIECPSINSYNTTCCGEQNCKRNYKKETKNFLQEVQRICNKNGIVFILDEMITGFRWDLHGAQNFYNVSPDLSTFGKAMANGFSLSCLAGKRDIMKLGSITDEGSERVFLLSSTHGAEMCSLGAFISNVSFMKRNNVISHQWEYGKKLINLFREKIVKYNIDSNFKIEGIPCSPYFLTLDSNGSNSNELRTLFIQEMIKNKVLMPYLSIAFRHGQKELELVEEALEKTFSIYAKAIDEGVSNYLEGPSIKPIFRKYN